MSKPDSKKLRNNSAVAKGVRKSWEDPEIARKRKERHFCDVRSADADPNDPRCWKRYSSTRRAFAAHFQDPTSSRSRHIAFRKRVKAAGLDGLEVDGLVFRAVPRSLPGLSESTEQRDREPLDQLVQFRVTASEKAAITAAAGDVPVGAFVRKLVLAEVGA